MTETPLRTVIARMATDDDFARAVREAPDGVAADYGLSPDDVATLSALTVDPSTRRPQRLEERLSRSALVFGGELHSGGDTGTDSGTDTGTDTGTDAGSDSGGDAGTDTGHTATGHTTSGSSDTTSTSSESSSSESSSSESSSSESHSESASSNAASDTAGNSSGSTSSESTTWETTSDESSAQHESPAGTATAIDAAPGDHAGAPPPGAASTTGTPATTDTPTTTESPTTSDTGPTSAAPDAQPGTPATPLVDHRTAGIPAEGSAPMAVAQAAGPVASVPVDGSGGAQHDGTVRSVPTLTGGDAVVVPDAGSAGDGASGNPFVRPAVSPAVAAAVSASATNYHGGVVGQQVSTDGAGVTSVRYAYGDGTADTAVRTTDPATGQVTDTITRPDGTTWSHAWNPADGPATGVWQTSAPDGTTTTFNEDHGVAYGHTDRPDGSTIDLQIPTPSDENDNLVLEISETGPEPDFAQTGIAVHSVAGGTPDQAYVTVTHPDGTASTMSAELRFTDNADGSRTTTILYRDGDTDSFTTRDGHVVDQQSVRHDGTVMTDPAAPDVWAALPDPVQQVVDRGEANDHGPVVGHEDLYQNFDGSTTMRLTYTDGTTAEFTRHVDVPDTRWHDVTVTPDGTEIVQDWHLDEHRTLIADQTVTTHPDGSVTTLTYEQPRTFYNANFTETTTRLDGSSTVFTGYRGYDTPNDLGGNGATMMARSIDIDADGHRTTTTYGTVAAGEPLSAIVDAPDGTRTVTPVWFGTDTIGADANGRDGDFLYTFVRPDGGTETVALGQRAQNAFDTFNGVEVRHWSTPPSAPPTTPPAPDQNMALEDGTTLPTDDQALVVTPDADPPTGTGADFHATHPFIPQDPDTHYGITVDPDGTEHSTVEGGVDQVRTIHPDGTGVREDWDPDPYEDRGGRHLVATWTIQRFPDGFWSETRVPDPGVDTPSPTTTLWAPDGSRLESGPLWLGPQSGWGSWYTKTYADGLIVDGRYEGGDYITSYSIPHDDGGWTELTDPALGAAHAEGYSSNGTLLWTATEGPNDTSFYDAEGHIIGGRWPGGQWGTVPPFSTAPLPGADVFTPHRTGHADGSTSSDGAAGSGDPGDRHEPEGFHPQHVPDDVEALTGSPGGGGTGIGGGFDAALADLDARLNPSTDPTAAAAPAVLGAAVAGAPVLSTPAPAVPAVDPNAGYHGGVVRTSAPAPNDDGSYTVHVRYGDGTTVEIHRVAPPTGGITDTWTEADGTTVKHTYDASGERADVTTRTAPDDTVTVDARHGDQFSSRTTRPDGTSSETTWGRDESTVYATVDHPAGGEQVETVVTRTSAGGYLATVTSSDGSVEHVRLTATDVDNPDGSTTRIFTYPDGDTDAFTTDADGIVTHHEARHPDESAESWPTEPVIQEPVRRFDPVSRTAP